MKRMQRKKLSLAVVNALNAGVVISLAAPLTYAQALTERIERIEVTGSRIPSPTLTSESPVNVISAQDIKYTGLTNTSDIINQLPQAYADQGNSLANGATGTSAANLRNLGSPRTLVLIDGKRVPAGDPNFWATDLNAIPAPLIQRVEVLTGGASAVYGSDAIAGVVNFIMNDRFEGVQLQWNANGYNHQQHNDVADIIARRSETNPSQFSVPGNVGLDGVTQDFSLTMGSNFANGKGNATLYFGYRKTEAILQGTRDFSACSLNGTAAGFACGGSGTSAGGQFFTETSEAFTIANTQGGVRPFTADDQFNFGPYNHFQRPDERYLFNAFAHYDVFPKVRVYAEFDFMADQTLTQIAPSGSFFQSATLFDNNPLLSQEFKNALGITAATPQTIFIGRRNVEGGGRQEDITHTNYRYVLGAKGDVLDGKWDYDFWWQSGKNIYARTYLNDFSGTRLVDALTVITDPTTGLPVCASGNAGCAPYDIFHTGGVTQAALDYLQTPGFQTGYTQQSVVGLNIRSDLGASYGWTMPLAKNGVGVAFGIERRVEKLNTEVDTFFSVPEGTGQGGATNPLNGQYTVVEPYAEIRIPIAERQPWAYDLTVTGAYRYSNYSTDQTTNSYGIGADWAPVKEAKLRGSYQQAVRAANIIELFFAQGFTLFDMSGGDPCGPAMTATLEQCLRTGLAPSQYGARILDSVAGQYGQLQGGNPALKPETAKTYTVGVVLQPLAGLSATVDYWHIEVEDAVGVIPPEFALSQCLNNGTFCGLIHRGPAGDLWLPNSGFVDGTNLNLGAYETDGIDVTLAYTTPIAGYGSLGVNFVGTFVNEFITTPVPGLGSYDCVGFYGPTCGAPQPSWRSRLQGIWNTPWNVNLALTWRYIGSADAEQTSSNPELAGQVFPIGASIGSQNYFDLAVQWNIDKNWSVRGGVNNIADRDPPLVYSGQNNLPFGNGNTWPGIYDSLGRNFFVNVTAQF